MNDVSRVSKLPVRGGRVCRFKCLSILKITTVTMSPNTMIMKWETYFFLYIFLKYMGTGFSTETGLSHHAVGENAQ